MNISALWASGCVEEWDTTVLSSGNGGGFAIAQDFLNVADPARHGVTVVRRAFGFAAADCSSIGPTGDVEEKTLIPAERVRNLLRLQANGETVLARVLDDEDGKPYITPDGALFNMLLPDGPALDGAMLAAAAAASDDDGGADPDADAMRALDEQVMGSDEGGSQEEVPTDAGGSPGSAEGEAADQEDDEVPDWEDEDWDGDL